VVVIVGCRFVVRVRILMRLRWLCGAEGAGWEGFGWWRCRIGIGCRTDLRFAVWWRG
jgi:hypothetical protein